MSIAKTYAIFKQSEKTLRCPLCGGSTAFRNENSLVCTKGHCFDLSKFGYINFAPNQSRIKYTKSLFESRRFIFQSGFYEPLTDSIEHLINEHAAPYANILDAGCGEGFFISKLAENLQTKEIFALDILKDAIALAARGAGDIKWLVGDLSHIPLQSDSMDLLLNIFAPANYGEFSRVMRGNGLLIKVIPGSEYLKELRECVKGQLSNKEYTNDHVMRLFYKNIHCIEKRQLFYQLPVNEEHVINFLQMTPLTLNVDKSILRLDNIKQITIDVEIVIGRGIY